MATEVLDELITEKFGFHVIEGIMRFDEYLKVKPKVKKQVSGTDPYLALSKLGPKKSQLRPLQKTQHHTIPTITEAKLEDEEIETLPSRLSPILKIEIGNLPPEK